MNIRSDGLVLLLSKLILMWYILPIFELVYTFKLNSIEFVFGFKSVFL